MPQEHFDAIIESTEDKQLAQMFDACKFRMYDLDAPARELDFPPKGTSAYYSEDITKEEVELVRTFVCLFVCCRGCLSFRPSVLFVRLSSHCSPEVSDD